MPRSLESPLTDMPAFAVESKPEVEVSACMMIMDDNHLLIEWIAYHYHNVNLRHLIVHSDKKSVTLPTEVLDRWRDRITITTWEEKDFMDVRKFEEKLEEKFNQTDTRRINYQTMIGVQEVFYLECMKAHKRKNRGWTLLTDTDEYVVPSDRMLREYNKTADELKVKDVLNELHIPPSFQNWWQPCLSFERRQFSLEETRPKKLQSMVPEGYDAKDFQTMRWRRYGAPRDRKVYETKFNTKCQVNGRFLNIPNKVMVDLSRLSLAYLKDGKHNWVGSAHQVLRICPRTMQKNTEFTLNHYYATREQWMARPNDNREPGIRLARHEAYSEFHGSKESDVVRHWLKDFVDTMGEDEAARLLEGVGKIDPVTKWHGKPKSAKYNTFKVGDIVMANKRGEGEWFEGEVYKSFSDNHYQVLLRDCDLNYYQINRIRELDKNETLNATLISS